MPRRFLRCLGRTSAVACGTAVLKYFDRSDLEVNTIDLCVRIDGLRELGATILDEGYTFCPADGDHKQFDITVLTHTSRKVSLSTSARTDPFVRCFRFVRCSAFAEGTHDSVSITVNLVRWEPWRYVLCAETSSYLNSWRI